ncbi:SDR family oxidoreductase [Streptomyces mobaraensis NBRC 13819 = DSM 40847]|uniref:Oxidoreductase n=1 Tax=Streptomyces mobaraensis (strain ATCC 29032 / DSM 40847 / JCM 4168 / NBRC 13819 / NCIMB 11159 / IPCR 16-22) TaxID=1223523 RepID=M3AV74_STRM1|nr:SDR family oxidoreductase [Streptomyces mobaraensis]EME97487.1 oxidoreductase [Streptomyces mobaraensis NBRC 13819 = DSM 40847]QTT72043.1 SDR family oxidoreductase [Streptomyces mobaraensis NBRC 13819 = DSM 40847]
MVPTNTTLTTSTPAAPTASASATQSRRLAGKVALVTGGSRGIGAATARMLAEAGADVAISYAASAARAEDVVGELTARGVRAAAYRADQADPEQVARLVTTVAEDFGRLDVLVNNAGVIASGTVGDPAADTAALDRQYAVNVGGVVAAIRSAAGLLSDDGRVITIGSNLAARTAFPGVADYAAGKAAVVGYSKGAARDLAPRRITVNVIAAGSTATDMNPQDGPTSDRQRSTNALGRYARPEEIAAGVLFLADPAASFVTGTVLTIDGGSLA